MIRITALNETSSGESSDGHDVELVTKEAQEEEALELYNKALELLRYGSYEESQKQFMELLDTDLLVRTLPSDDHEEINQPGFRMKYSAYKNLAEICLHQKQDKDAIKYLLEAVNIDDSDVTLWHKIGIVATSIQNYPLARLAFEEGLRCNENHWPCLDKLITVLYVLNDYGCCLSRIAKGLKRESGFVKGLAFRDAIFKEQPGLKIDIHDFYKNCESLNVVTEYDEAVGQKFTNEALEMREKRRELAKQKPRPILNFQQPLKVHAWKNLGERFCELYEYVKKNDPPITPCCQVNLSKQSAVSSAPSLPAATATPLESDTSPSSSMSQSLSVATTPTSTPAVLTTPSSPTKAPSVTSSATTTQPTSGNELMDVDIDIAASGDLPEDSSIIRRAPKRKRQRDELLELAAKRRSTRVRNTGKKSMQENINYYEMLHEYLPPDISGQEEDYDSSNAPSVECDNHITNDHHYGHSGFQVDCSPRSSDCSSLQSTEEADVKDFLLKYQSSHSLIDIMYYYLHELGARSHLSWPQGLSNVFMATYNNARHHFEHPCVSFQDEEDEYIRNEAWVTLVYNELKMDKWQCTKPRATTSPVLSHRNNHASLVLGPDFPGQFFINDLDFIKHTSFRKDILQERWSSFALRGLWLHARYLILQGEIERALIEFNQMLDVLDLADYKEKIEIANVTADNVISKDDVEKQMSSVRQCQSLEEVQRLYDQENYERVVDLLVATFNEKQQLKHKICSDIPERHAQLLLLQNSLMKLNDFSKCIQWQEKSINEALQQYTIVSGISTRTEWASTMTQLLEGLETCIKEDASIISCLELKQLKRLYQNLIKVISLQMNSPELTSDISINTLVPWILLFRLVQFHEKKTKPVEVKVEHEEDETGQEANSKPKPLSLMLLFMAHDCLGRRSWCCALEGSFLLQLTEILLAELRQHSLENPHPLKVEIENNLEQCFFCLYGHPSKKTKAKHLQEHGSPQLQLTWERAQPLFNFFKPKQIPSFDSYKTNTISSDVENLFRRIVTLIPNPSDQQITPDSVSAYIEGTNDAPPSKDIETKKRPIIDEIYYLLADYYFKNKEQGKALKFYILDICVNPNRMDSWAGMALARSSQIEQKLNSNEFKSDGPIYRKTSTAIKCFQRAVEIDPYNLTVWIEYGSLAYEMHAHSSRQLKQKNQFDLSDEIIEMLKEKKKELLNVAFVCFKTASEFTDDGNGIEERWLHHYMLGKIAEKKTRNEPQTYLFHYKKAAHHLHLDGARYPRKINYHNPPFLSLESLEVYYRVNSSILKFLMQNNQHACAENLQYIATFLKQLAASPFVKFQENILTTLEEISTEEKKRDDHLAKAKSNMAGNSNQSNDSTNAQPEEESTLSVAIDVLDHLITEVSKEDPVISCTVTTSAETSNEGTKTDDKVTTENVSKDSLMKMCANGVKQCVIRFSQHYKSLYRLANYYFKSSAENKPKIGYEYLIGSTAGVKQSKMVSPGLFNERKNTNFFNGIWRIPVDELDRPGSFPYHMYRSVSLLKDIVKHIKDMLFFCHLTCQLHRIPDPGKKYLRDIDRSALADQIYRDCVDTLRDRMDSLMQEEPPPTEERILTCLLDIYKAWQTLHKNVPDPDPINDLFEEAYTMYKLGEVDSSPPVLDQAIAFCQKLIQMQAEKAKILQQQKVILEQQRAIEKTLLSAGIQPGLSSGIDVAANLASATSSLISVTSPADLVGSSPSSSSSHDSS